MDASSRIVFGFHGTTPAIASGLVSGDIPLEKWKPSKNDYDWLGSGIYFWEFAPDRAKSWMEQGGAVGAIIQLGNCLDLTDITYTDALSEAYRQLVASCRRRRKPIPQNRGKRRDLDCAVINRAVKQIEERTGDIIHSVRGAFLEGEPVFPGSAILRETHIQVAVREKSCIVGLFRPTGERKDRS